MPLKLLQAGCALIVMALHGASALTDAGREHAFVGYSEKGTPKEASGALCTDESSFCGDWAQQGECTKCARRPPKFRFLLRPAAHTRPELHDPHCSGRLSVRLSPPHGVGISSHH